MSKVTKTVSVIIPSWNSEAQLRGNLPSVFRAAAAVKAEIIIVDDFSEKDGSAAYLTTLGKKIKYLRNESNLGFSATVNRGVAAASGDLIILLNTDVRPEPDCFTNALQYFGPGVFAVTFNSGEGCMRAVWGKGLFHHFKYEPVMAGSAPVPSMWASGGQGAYDRRIWNILGGLDLLYRPFYWEDTDLGYNAWRSGYQILFASDCRCVHDHRKSVIAGSFDDSYIFETAQRNQFLFVWKNISDLKFLLAHVLYLPYYIYQYPKTLALAFRHLPQALAARKRAKKLWQKSDRDILKIWA